MQYLSSLFLGLILSFLGQLPLGTMSMTATQIAVQENFRNAWKYSIGVAIIEMVYLRVVLSGMQWIIGHQELFNIFNWITVILFGVFGVMSFIAAQKQGREKKMPSPELPARPVFTGREYECPESGSDSFLVYVVRIFFKPGLAETRIFQLQCIYTGFGPWVPLVA